MMQDYKMKTAWFIVLTAGMLLRAETPQGNAQGAKPVQAAAPSKYVIAHKFPIAGNDGWDFILADETKGRLFVSHGTQVQVVDEKTGKLLGTVPDTKGVHGIAIVPDLNRGFTSNGKDTSVTVFDLETYATLGKIRTTGNNPDAILYDPFSRLVFTFNGKSSNATVIDPKTNSVIATIALEGKPEVPVSDGKGTLFVNLEDQNRVTTLDTKTKKVLGTFSIAPGESPSGMAIDLEDQRLFIVCENKLMIVADSKTHEVVALVPIGDKVDGVAFDPVLKRAYASNGEGTVTVVQETDKDHFKVLETVATQKGARTIALDAKTHHIFLPTAEFGAPPEPTTENPKPRPAIKPGTFVVIDVEPST